MADCLSPDEAAALLKGGEPARGLAAAQRHVEGCTACRAQLSRAGDDGTSLAMTEAPSGEPGPGDAIELAVVPVPGRYRVVLRPDGSVDELGRGGFGKVLLARDQLVGRDVALKQLTARRLERNGSAAEARLVREARVMSQLEHPAVVPLHELGRDTRGTLYYTMRRIRGRTLAQALHAETSLEGRLRHLPRLLTACQAVAYAHSRGVVHRDLKPQNVMLDRFGATYVIDWGLARANSVPDDATLPDSSGALRIVASDETIDDQHGRLGTPAYMSPEQLKGNRALVDEKSDVWGLGAMLFEVLSGTAPRSRAAGTAAGPVRPVREVEPRVPSDLAAICDKACAEAREARYATADALAHDLDAWLHGRQVSAHAYGPGELLGRFLREHRLTVAVAAVAVMLFFAGGLVSYLRVRAQRNQARAFALLIIEQVQQRVSESHDLKFAATLTASVSQWLRETGQQGDAAAVAWAWFELAQGAERGEGTSGDFVRNCLAAAEGCTDVLSRSAWVGCKTMEVMPNLSAQLSPEGLSALRQLASTPPPGTAEPSWFRAQHLLHERLYLSANDRADKADQRVESAALVAIAREQLSAAADSSEALIALASALERQAFTAANDGEGARAISLGDEALEFARRAMATRSNLRALSELVSLLNQQVLFLRWQHAAAGPGGEQRRAELGAEALSLWDALEVLDPGEEVTQGKATLLLELGRPAAAWEVLRAVDLSSTTVMVRANYGFAALASGHHRELLQHKAAFAAGNDFDHQVLVGLALARDGQFQAAAGALRRATSAPHSSGWPPPTMLAFAATLDGPLREFIVEASTLLEADDSQAIDQALGRLATALEAMAEGH